MSDKKNVSKNIRFIKSNSLDMKILQYFDENPNEKFGTVVKELLLNYVSSKEKTHIDDVSDANIEELIEQKVQKYMNSLNNYSFVNRKEDSKDNSDFNMNIIDNNENCKIEPIENTKDDDNVIQEEVQEVINMKPDLLSQIRNFDK